MDKGDNHLLKFEMRLICSDTGSDGSIQRPFIITAVAFKHFRLKYFGF